MLHGGLDNAFSWAPILAPLAAARRVLAVDLPGHGLADPFDFRTVDLLDHGRIFVRDVLNELGLEVVDLAASSIGALYATSFALAEPGRVAHLVLAGAPAGLMRPGVALPLRLLALPGIGRPLGRRLMSNPKRDANRKFWGEILVARPEQLDDDLLDADVASQRHNIETHLSLIRSVADAGGVRRRFVMGERWQLLTMPTLVIWGERDAFISPDKGQAIASANPNVRVVRIRDAGHLPWHDEPERVAAEIDRFL